MLRKAIHAKWPADFYNHMTTLEGEKVIESCLIASGITNALKNGETGLEPLDSFADIDRDLMQNRSSDRESDYSESE